MQPFVGARDAGLASPPVRDVVWIIIDRSTSSKWPRRISSGLPPGILEPPAPGPGPPPLDVAILLGGDGEEDHASGQVIRTPWRRAAPWRRRAAEPPARCGRRRAAPVCRIGEGMAGDDERVELAEQREGRASSPPRPATSARTPVRRQAALGRRAQTPHRSPRRRRAVFTSLKPSRGSWPDLSRRDRRSPRRACRCARWMRCFSSGFGHGFLPGAPSADRDSSASIRGAPRRVAGGCRSVATRWPSGPPPWRRPSRRHLQAPIGLLHRLLHLGEVADHAGEDLGRRVVLAAVVLHLGLQDAEAHAVSSPTSCRRRSHS